jgi:hypothetical protein
MNSDLSVIKESCYQLAQCAGASYEVFGHPHPPPPLAPNNNNSNPKKNKQKQKNKEEPDFVSRRSQILTQTLTPENPEGH